MSSSYGISGSNPVAQYATSVNHILKDAIKARWDPDYTTPLSITFPLSTNILWLNTWRIGVKEVELVFLLGFHDIPPEQQTIGQKMEMHIETVDLHIWVKGIGGDVEPPTLHKVLNGLNRVVAFNKSTLVPNAEVRIASTQPAVTNPEVDFKTYWHYLMKLRVSYWSTAS